MSALLLAVVASLSAHAGATASDFKAERKMGANTWNAQSAIDGKPETCWMLPGESKNKGEWIILDAPKSTLSAIGMIVGWSKDEETFADYARVKSIKIEVMAYDENNELQPMGEATAEFADKAEYQVVDIEDIAIGEDLFGGKVKLTIEEVYPGRDYPNLAISELALHLAEFDANVQVDGASSESPGHTIDMLIDDSDKTFWAGDVQGATLTVKSAGFSIARLGLTHGGKEYARAKKVRVTAHSRSHELEIADATGMQWIEIPPTVGFTGSGYQGSEFEPLEIEILEVYPGSKYPDQVAIKELGAKATSFGGF